MRFRWHVHLECGCIMQGNVSHKDYLKAKEAFAYGELEDRKCLRHKGKHRVVRIDGCST